MCWGHTIVVGNISQYCFILDLATPSLAIESSSRSFGVPSECLIIIGLYSFFYGAYYGLNCIL